MIDRRTDDPLMDALSGADDSVPPFQSAVHSGNASIFHGNMFHHLPEYPQDKCSPSRKPVFEVRSGRYHASLIRRDRE